MDEMGLDPSYPQFTIFLGAGELLPQVSFELNVSSHRKAGVEIPMPRNCREPRANKMVDRDGRARLTYAMAAKKDAPRRRRARGERVVELFSGWCRRGSGTALLRPLTKGKISVKAIARYFASHRTTLVDEV